MPLSNQRVQLLLAREYGELPVPTRAGTVCTEGTPLVSALVDGVGLPTRGTSGERFCFGCHTLPVMIRVNICWP